MVYNLASIYACKLKKGNLNIDIMKMNRKLILLTAALAVTGGMASCKGEAKSGQSASDADSAQVAPAKEQVAEPAEEAIDLGEIETETITMDEKWDFVNEELAQQSQEVGDGFQPSCSLEITFPTDKQSPELSKAVRAWIVSQCLSEYKGDKNDMNALAKAFVEQTKKGDGDEEVDLSVNKMYENANVITFSYSYSMYAYGAAHGMHGHCAATFCKKDGRRLSWDMFKKDTRWKPILEKGLMEYFDCGDRETLSDNLFDALGKLEKPATEPWVSADGIELLYQLYEICPYAAGMPELTIPIKKAESILVPEVYELLK